MRSTPFPSALAPMLTLTLLGSGCSFQKLAVNQTAGILKEANHAMQSERDLVLAEDAIPAGLKTVEGFLEAHKTQPILLQLLAEGYMSYAFGFIEDQAEAVQDTDFQAAEALRERALDFHLRAREFGLRLLELDFPELAATLREGAIPSVEQLAEVEADEMAGLFWTANPWAAAINVGKHKPELVAQLTLVRTLMERCDALDPGFFYGGPPLALGAMDAGIPAALGGRPKLASQHFERAIALTDGNFFMARVLYARSVGVQTGDRTMFERELTEVVEADPDVVSGWALPNRLAQRRARRYLSEIDETFLDDLEDIDDLEEDSGSLDDSTDAEPEARGDSKSTAQQNG